MTNRESDGDYRPLRAAPQPLLRKMTGRSAEETGRVSTPLELLFDLTFVVAVSSAAAGLGHALSEGHFHHGLIGYAEIFFAIWWAWMNFTWFASGYDTDDVLYRLLTMLQMGGALVLAAGVPNAFEHGNFKTIAVGYLIMRVAMVAQWLRVAYSDRANRRVALTYSFGILIVQTLWLLRLAVPHTLPNLSFLILALLEVSIPAFAELGGRTPNGSMWHPHHIAERYGLFTIIVLGECVLAATVAVQGSLTTEGVSLQLVLTGAGGLVLVFGLWWLYFLSSAGEALSERRQLAILWGYGHYVTFGALAALGAGLEVTAEALTEHLEISDRAVGYCVATPVFLYLVAMHLLYGKLLVWGSESAGISDAAAAVGFAVVILAPLCVGVLGLGGVVAMIALGPALLVAESMRTSRVTVG